MQYRIIISTLVFISCTLIGCEMFQQRNKPRSQDDKLLARVENRSLYLSDLEGMINAENSTDSTIQISSFVETWLKRNVLLAEAEDNFPENIDINKLVEDYRSSLLLHNYRQLLVDEQLDTLVTPEQENEYYEKNKEQYLLSSPLVKAQIVEVPDNTRGLEKFYRNWKKNDEDAIQSYIDANAKQVYDMKDIWISEEKFLSLLPNNLFSRKDLKKKGNLQKHHGSSEFFIKIQNVIDKNEVAPLVYIQDNIRKVIIHKRKKKLLETIEDNLYNSYMKANRFKVYN